jgi:hypothetical protein
MGIVRNTKRQKLPFLHSDGLHFKRSNPLLKEVLFRTELFVEPFVLMTVLVRKTVIRVQYDVTLPKPSTSVSYPRTATYVKRARQLQLIPLSRGVSLKLSQGRTPKIICSYPEEDPPVGKIKKKRKEEKKRNYRETVVSARRLCQYFQFPDKTSRHISSNVYKCCVILKYFGIYSILYLITPNNVTWNRVEETLQ